MAGEAADAGLRADQRGSIFPSLDGAEPGDQEVGADITGIPLEPLTPPDAQDMPRAAGTGETISNVPAALEGAPAPEPTQVAGGDIEPPVGRKPRTAQERIAQLTRRYRQEQETRNGVEVQLQQTLGLLAQQQQEIMALKSGRVAPAQSQANEAADALGLSAQPTGQAPITLDAVRSVVRDVITDYDAQVRQKSSAVEQLRASHIETFKDAASEMPELLDQRSRARQIFDELYASSPLRALPDGPYQIALQIPGILASEQRRGQAASPERKRQVGASVPAPVGSGAPDGGLAGLKREFARVTQLHRNDPQNFQVYKQWRGLREQIANAQRRG